MLGGACEQEGEGENQEKGGGGGWRVCGEARVFNSFRSNICWGLLYA